MACLDDDESDVYIRGVRRVESQFFIERTS